MSYQMTTDAAIAQSYLYATGKTTALVGTTKYTKLLALLNSTQQNWANMPNVDWASLRTTVNLSSVVTATDTFALGNTLSKISDQEGDAVRILHTDGVSESMYTTVPIERLYEDKQKRLHWDDRRVAQSGTNLVFSHAFVTGEAQIGGTIVVPGYSIPATLVGGTSEFIIVDDPFWACFMVAAEYVRNDVTRVQLRPSLIEQANLLEAGMRERNDAQYETVLSNWRPLGMTF